MTQERFWNKVVLTAAITGGIAGLIALFTIDSINLMSTNLAIILGSTFAIVSAACWAISAKQFKFHNHHHHHHDTPEIEATDLKSKEEIAEQTWVKKLNIKESPSPQLGI